MSEDLTFERQGRRWGAFVTLVLIWGALWLAWAQLEAAWWLVLGFGALTVPAAWEWLVNARAGFSADATAVRWHSGRVRQEVAWREILHLRLDTRLDLSVRATLALKRGRRLRVPLEAMPPAEHLEAVFAAKGVPVERQHFSFLG